MKYLFLLSLLSLFIISNTTAQTRQINQFYHKHRNDKGVINVTIPGLLIRWSGKIARKHTKNDPVAQAALKMVKKVKNMRMLIVEGENEFPVMEFNKMTNRLKKHKGYEDMIMVRSKGTQVNVMAKGKNDKLKHLLFLVNDEDNFVMFSMKTSMKMKDFSKVVNEIIRAEKAPRPTEEDLEKEKKPQA